MDNNQEVVKKDSSVGPIIGSVIIIILIILGGLYFWGYVINEQKVEAPVTPVEKQ